MNKINSVAYLLLVICFFFSSCGTTNRISFFTKKINGLAMVKEKKNKNGIVKIFTNVKINHTSDYNISKNDISFMNNKLVELNNNSSNRFIELKEMKQINSIFKHKLPQTSLVSYKNFNFFDSINSKAKEKTQEQIGRKILNSNQKSGGNGLVISSVILLALGLLILFFASIILGAVLMFLGLVFLIVALAIGNGGGSSGVKNDKYKQEYQDVVYLKNGGILRGMIIEQIPNVQLKIQTKDGSVFVYKIEEIEKITKELSK